MTKKDYMAMSMDLFRILSPDMCEEDEAKASANEEWKNDSAGLKARRCCKLDPSLKAPPGFKL